MVVRVFCHRNLFNDPLLKQEDRIRMINNNTVILSCTRDDVVRETEREREIRQEGQGILKDP